VDLNCPLDGVCRRRFSDVTSFGIPWSIGSIALEIFAPRLVTALQPCLNIVRHTPPKMLDRTVTVEEGVMSPSSAARHLHHLPRQGYLEVMSLPRPNEATMITRKPKPTHFPLIEWPTEQLQLVPVTVKHQAPVRAGQIILAGAAAFDGVQHPDGSVDQESLGVSEFWGIWR
jgi:hypothetical protein